MCDQFIEAVTAHLEDIEFFSVGSCHACEECNPDGLDESQELHTDNEFSSVSCDSCGTYLAGSRHAAHYIDDGRIWHCDVCVDCLMYHANGDTPETWRKL